MSSSIRRLTVKPQNLLPVALCVLFAVAIAFPAMIIGGIKCLGFIFEGIGNYGFDAPEVEIP